MATKALPAPKSGKALHPTYHERAMADRAVRIEVVRTPNDSVSVDDVFGTKVKHQFAGAKVLAIFGILIGIMGILSLNAFVFLIGAIMVWYGASPSDACSQCREKVKPGATRCPRCRTVFAAAHAPTAGT